MTVQERYIQARSDEKYSLKHKKTPSAIPTLDAASARPSARMTVSIIGMLVLVFILVIGLATFLMNYFSHKEKFFPVSIKEKILDKNTKISQLKKTIAKLENEVNGLQKLNNAKTSNIKYITKKSVDNFNKYKNKKYKFFITDGQVFVGKLTKVLKKEVIIYNYSTKTNFIVEKSMILDVLTTK